jgi:hypothetical protein
MPYVECSACGLATFTAAYRFQADTCENCGTELPRPRGQEPVGQRSRGELESAMREQLYPRVADGPLDRQDP